MRRATGAGEGKSRGDRATLVVTNIDEAFKPPAPLPPENLAPEVRSSIPNVPSSPAVVVPLSFNPLRQTWVTFEPGSPFENVMPRLLQTEALRNLLLPILQANMPGGHITQWKALRLFASIAAHEKATAQDIFNIYNFMSETQAFKETPFYFEVQFLLQRSLAFGDKKSAIKFERNTLDILDAWLGAMNIAQPEFAENDAEFPFFLNITVADVNRMRDEIRDLTSALSDEEKRNLRAQHFRRLGEFYENVTALRESRMQPAQDFSAWQQMLSGSLELSHSDKYPVYIAYYAALQQNYELLLRLVNAKPSGLERQPQIARGSAADRTESLANMKKPEKYSVDSHDWKSYIDFLIKAAITEGRFGIRFSFNPIRLLIELRLHPELMGDQYLTTMIGLNGEKRLQDQLVLKKDSALETVQLLLMYLKSIRNSGITSAHFILVAERFFREFKKEGAIHPISLHYLYGLYLSGCDDAFRKEKVAYLLLELVATNNSFRLQAVAALKGLYERGLSGVSYVDGASQALSDLEASLTTGESQKNFDHHLQRFLNCILKSVHPKTLPEELFFKAHSEFVLKEITPVPVAQKVAETLDSVSDFAPLPLQADQRLPPQQRLSNNRATFNFRQSIRPGTHVSLQLPPPPPPAL